MNNTIDYYNNNAKEYFDETVRADMSKNYDKFLEYIKPGSYILDAGCGSGRDSKFFISKGYKVKAIDGSSQMCELASKYLGQEVDCVDFLDINYRDEYDAIWACASLLHVEKKDIVSVINNLHDSLKTDGILYASFKFGNCDRIQGGRYFNDQNEKSINELFKQFEIKEFWFNDDVRPGRTEKWINIIAKKKMVIKVVAAIIEKKDKILIAERSYGEFAGLWEFPGGKYEKEETGEQAIKREIREEFDADIYVKNYLCTVEHKYTSFYLIMDCYVCELLSDEMVLHDHLAKRWISPTDNDIDWVPADKKVIEAYLNQ